MRYLLESVPARSEKMVAQVRKQRVESRDIPPRKVRVKKDAATLPPATPYNATQLRHLRAEFDRTSSWLEEALEQGGELHTLQSVWDLLESGSSYLWPLSRSAGVLTVADYPLGRVMTVWLAGGELDEILAADADLVAWAKSNGCTHFQMIGRAGWTKVLRALGWDKTGVTLKRRL